MLRGVGPAHALAIVSHRHLRYASGLLHLLLLASSLALVRSGRIYRIALGAQIALLATAAARSGIARYYVLVTWATVPALINYLRAGVSPVWEKAEGTR
jgi:hypothetical protein